MSTKDSRSTIMTKIESLNSAMPDFRKSESTVKSLKAEVAAANVQFGLSDSSISSAELSRLVERYLEAW